MQLKSVDRVLLGTVAVAWLVSSLSITTWFAGLTSALAWCAVVLSIVGYRARRDNIEIMFRRRAGIRTRVLAMAKASDGQMCRGEVVEAVLAHSWDVPLEAIDDVLSELELHGLCLRDPLDVTGAERLVFPGLRVHDRALSVQPVQGAVVTRATIQ